MDRQRKKTSTRTHKDVDSDQLAVGREVAEKIRDRLALTREAAAALRDQLERRTNGGLGTDLDEWLQILEHWHPVAQLLESDSPRGRRLRQSPIIIRALTRNERTAIAEAARTRRK